MSGKTVFLCYRRNAPGKAFARLIEQPLIHRGYNVFLDVDSFCQLYWGRYSIRRCAFWMLITLAWS